MLQFIVVFFCTLVSVVAVNVLNHIEDQMSIVNDESVKVYFNSLIQRQLFSYSFCKKESEQCNRNTLSNLSLYLPLSMAEGPLQKNIYTCYQKLDSSGFVLVSGYSHDFFKEKVGFLESEKVLNSLIETVSIDAPLIVYTDRKELVSIGWNQINSCIVDNDPPIHSIFLVSKITSE